MTGISIRNRSGQLVEASEFTASEAKHKFGQLLDIALREGPVMITKQRKPAAVLISLEEYRQLTQAEDRGLAALSAEFDRRFAGAQGAKAASAMEKGIAASEARLAQLAEASVAAPRRAKVVAAKKVAVKRRVRKRA